MPKLELPIRATQDQRKGLFLPHPNDVHTQFFENEQGDVWVPTFDPNNGQIAEPVPKEYNLYHYICGRSVSENLSLVNEDGTYSSLCSSTQTFPEDLVLAMVTSGDYNLRTAIIVAGFACERCMNEFADHYGLEWGYSWESDEGEKSNTACRWCRRKNDIRAETLVSLNESGSKFMGMVYDPDNVDTDAPVLGIARCPMCKELPRFVESDDEQYPAKLEHQKEDCTNKFSTYNREEEKCIELWNQHVERVTPKEAY